MHRAGFVCCVKHQCQHYRQVLHRFVSKTDLFHSPGCKTWTKLAPWTVSHVEHFYSLELGTVSSEWKDGCDTSMWICHSYHVWILNLLWWQSDIVSLPLMKLYDSVHTFSCECLFLLLGFLFKHEDLQPLVQSGNSSLLWSVTWFVVVLHSLNMCDFTVLQKALKHKGSWLQQGQFLINGRSQRDSATR